MGKRAGICCAKMKKGCGWGWVIQDCCTRKEDLFRFFHGRFAGRMGPLRFFNIFLTRSDTRIAVI